MTPDDPNPRPSGSRASRVAVLGGGRSSEHDVSRASAASVAAGLRESGFEVVEVEISREGVWRWTSGLSGTSGTSGLSGMAELAGQELALVPGRGFPHADVVFPVLHGPFGEDGTVQGLLETLDVPYVGAGVLASAACMDKIVFKDLMASAGVPQVDYRQVAEDQWAANRRQVLRELAELELPVFVKPARLGSSVGIARVLAAAEMAAALDEAFRHDSLVIAEAGATGIEVECSVLGNDDPIVSAPGEIMLAAGESGWYDYEAKYTPGGMELMVPARISASAAERVRELAVRAFQRSGCAGLARADFFVDGETVLVNELNTMPGFTPTSVYGTLWDHSGIPYPELLARLVQLAQDRFDRERHHRF